MTSRFGAAVRSRRLTRPLLVVGAVVALVAIGAFVIDAEGTTPEPVAFDETIRTGMTFESVQTLDNESATVPKAQVFHSQYQFVVGYRGVAHMVDELQQPGYTQQYGQPVAVYVSDFAGTEPTVSEEGYPRTAAEPGWVRAENAAFVVDSEARMPAGDAIVPFSSDAAADAFADDHGGTVLSWGELRTRSVDIDRASVVRDQVQTKHERGDERVAAVRPLADREVSVVVGEDAPTVQAAVDAAEPDSTVHIPPGTYDETVVVDRPVTLAGTDATIRGDSNGSVVEVRSDDVAIQGVTIEGVGESTEPEEGEVEDEQWDAFVEAGYGHSDAAIDAEEVAGLYIADVTIETPASGVVLRDVDGAVVERTTIQGRENPRDGFMGVLSIRSPVVVQNATLEDGRDGIYLHRAEGSVIRNNTFIENRFGSHLMYTSDALLANNVARGQDGAGITIMTDPARNAVVGNEVYNASSGLDISGSFTYVAGNTVAGSERGMMGGTEQSLYERNVLYDNDLGFRTGSIRPSNRIVRNDFVDNDEPVRVGTGPLRIWSHDGSGNYWSNRPTGVATDSYSPTATLDASLHDTEGAVALSASPAARALDAVRNTVAGTREGEVLDTAPRSAPVRPETIDELEATDDD